MEYEPIQTLHVKGRIEGKEIIWIVPDFMQLELGSVFHFTLLLKTVCGEWLTGTMHGEVIARAMRVKYADAVRTGHHANRYLVQPLVQKVLASLASLLSEE